MENKDNKSLKTKLSNAFNGAKETIKNTGEAIKQGVEKIGTKAKQAGEVIKQGAEKIGTKVKQKGAGMLLGAALLTGATLTTSCAQFNNPYMPELPEDPTIEAPYEEEQTEQTPNIETEQENPSIDIPSVEPTPDEPEQEQEQEQEKEQKLPDINNGEPHDETNDDYEVTFREYHSDPYSRIYNCGFTVHNFFGEKPDMDQESAEYALYGVDYLCKQLDNFEKSLKGRSAAQHYFDEFITRSKGEIMTLAKEYPDKSTVDFSLLSDVMNAIITNGMYVMKDFVDAQPDDKSRKATDIHINGLMVDGWRFGGGKNFLTSPGMQNQYYRARNEVYDLVNASFPEDTDRFKQEPLIDMCSYHISLGFEAMSKEGKLHAEVTAEDMMAMTNFMACASTIQGGYESLSANGYDIGNAKAIINPAQELHNYINDKYLQKDAEQDLQK